MEGGEASGEKLTWRIDRREGREGSEGGRVEAEGVRWTLVRNVCATLMKKVKEVQEYKEHKGGSGACERSTSECVDKEKEVK